MGNIIYIISLVIYTIFNLKIIFINYKAETKKIPIKSINSNDDIIVEKKINKNKIHVISLICLTLALIASIIMGEMYYIGTVIFVLMLEIYGWPRRYNNDKREDYYYKSTILNFIKDEENLLNSLKVKSVSSTKKNETTKVYLYDENDEIIRKFQIKNIKKD